MESFKGTVNGRTGTFNFVHSASTTGLERNDAIFCIVAGSGTNELKGISGPGRVYIAFQTVGLQHTSITNTAFVTGLDVLLTPVFKWVLLRKRVEPRPPWRR
ncbi:MAG: DUF3224 domain-containing protein [Pseudomonas alloputida]|uniref:DUF3224 domain-containing protein n=1 Tax=Pseudomonas putida TaxID=303 RepID=A0AAW5HLI1_PSEPU|nr:DUF3224 domain-containing protein [Pseudomonas putida]MCO1621929.1 DUF3224 domain-containing protein [Pseudomonas putida]